MLDVRRREFITLIGGLASWPFVARAGGRRARIAVLTLLSSKDEGGRVGAFAAGLRRRSLVQMALAARLPTEDREDVKAGGLSSCGIDYSENYRRAAVYVDKILKGARPGDLPIEFPTKLELVINLKTAKALGITISATVIGRADEVIE
jgi:hypothetical protein